MTLAEFRRVYPTAAFTVSSGKLFTYRYYQNPQAKATLVLLTGGIGLSDLFYKHFARFARDFSVLTFDYQLQFGDNGEFADAVAELLRHLKEKVWLVGQSLGGVVAQVIASRHPEVVEGLVLSNTCSLSGNMSKAGYQDLDVYKRQGIHPGRAAHHSGAGQKQQGAKAHQPHLGKIPHNAGQSGDPQSPLYRPGDFQQPPCHGGDGIGKSFTHGSTPPLPAAPAGPAPPPGGGRAPAGPSAPGGTPAGKLALSPAHR